MSCIKAKKIGNILRRKFKVEYDWKPPSCLQCKVFGHAVNKCPKNIPKEDMQKENKDNEGFIHVGRKRGYDNGGKKNVRITHKENKCKGERRSGEICDYEPTTFLSYYSKWSKEMLEYFREKRKAQYEKDKNKEADRNEENEIILDENDVYVNRSGTTKFMTINEVSGIGLGKKPKQNEVKEANLWSWQHNERKSRKGCRIAVGWDSNSMKCFLINSTEQSMLYNVEVLSTQEAFFCTFILCLLIKERDSKELWKETKFETKEVVGNKNWECVNKTELEDINCSGLHFTWTKSLLNPNAIVLKKIDRIISIKYKKVDKMRRVEVLFDRKISKEEADLMIREVQDIEIKKALFDINDDKAPGTEGFTSTFFKKSWEFVNKDFCTTIKEFFSSGKLLGEVKATFNKALIPNSFPQKVSDFRHIACCNVVYKCISKILTNRIKSALNQIVDDNQSAFVPGRAITDNILLTQELLKGYNCINGPKRVSFKIDIQKAYDIVNWNFIEDMLQNFGFPYKIIKWIMICITTPKFTICVNVLNLLVRNEIKKESAFKYHFGCKQMKITHLCFADDLIMLCHGDRCSVTVLRNALSNFSKVSGLHPNLNKCTMFCGSLDEETRNEISSIFPFKEGKLPVRYLGVPLVTKKIGITDCKQLIDKVNQKLSDWKNKTLSYAGRAQLIASVLGSMQNSGESCKGKAKVAWKEVCKPKDQGGLGFKSLELWNKTLLVKHLWNVASRKESLWVKWINAVKLKDRNVWDVDVDSKDSWCWKCLLNLRNWISNNMRYKIGNGESINVWHDKWFEGTSLSSFFSKKEIFYAGFKDQDKIKDVIGEDGWKWPNEWIVKVPWLANLQVPILSSDPDKAIWIDNNGNEKRFSTNTVWKDVRGENEKVKWYNLVWHPNGIPKHSFILWLAVKEKLNTQDRMEKWYPNKMFRCSLCNKKPDSHEHLFFKCEFSSKVWEKICEMAKLKLKEDKWENILTEMSKDTGNRSIWMVIKKLCLAAAVYFI
ncbi:RNA-directed DNA polymerase, eukaryota, reverse transcriptase zinc-binding domain protein [Tanacetum coccineum]